MHLGRIVNGWRSSLIGAQLRGLATKAKRKINEQKCVDGYPSQLFTRKYETPPSLYLAVDDTAAAIVEALRPHLAQINCNLAFEMNPGKGLLTRHLLQLGFFEKMILFESMEYFLPGLQKLAANESSQMKVKRDDLVNIWKLAYQDKMVNSTRVRQLLEELPNKAYDDDPNAVIIGAVGSRNFFKHLIHSVIFQTSILSFGRSEMFVIIPPPVYIHLTCDKSATYVFYRANSILFQILFEYRFITKVKREHFLPTLDDRKDAKNRKVARIRTFDQDHLYLVRLAPRRNLFTLCPQSDLIALWYFVRQSCNSRRNRIIPSMEKYVPGCGPRLLINESHSPPSSRFFSDEDTCALPKYSQPCVKLSGQAVVDDMTIYTEFGDLSIDQMLTLFTAFRSWPEYKDSCFLASLESSLLKIEIPSDDAIIINTEEEADNCVEEEAAKFPEQRASNDHNNDFY